MTGKGWSPQAWILVLLLGGCSGRLAPLGSTGGPGDQPPPDGGGDAAPSVEAPVGDEAPPLEAGGADPGDGWGQESWRQSLELIHDRNDTFRARRTECLHIPGEGPSPYEYPSDADLQPSLAFGFITVEEEAMSECMALLRDSSCDEIAALAGATDLTPPATWVPARFAPCARAVTGRVAPGGNCLRHFDCQFPDKMWCGGKNACGSTCTPLLPEGNAASMAGEGAACDDVATVCLPGLYCAFARLGSHDAGTCRRVETGGPCQSSWACPRTYACVGATPSEPGTCRAGKRVGEPCVVLRSDYTVSDGDTFSDCAFDLNCVDLDGRGPRCVSTAAPGEHCGELQDPLGSIAHVDCAQGTCDITENGAGVCRAAVGPGEACTTTVDCIPPTQCRFMSDTAASGICTTPTAEHPEGFSCPYPECGYGTYCGGGERGPPGARPIPDRCKALRKAGESCTGSDCEFLTKCVNGMCTKC